VVYLGFVAFAAVGDGADLLGRHADHRLGWWPCQQDTSSDRTPFAPFSAPPLKHGYRQGKEKKK
jgi:hypothetical protein